MLRLATLVLVTGCRGLLGIDDGVVSDAPATPDVRDASDPDAAPSPWWDAKWTKRQPVTLDAAGLSLPVTIPVLVRVANDEVSFTGDDLRVIADDQQTVLPLFIDSATDPAVVWTRLTITSPTQRVWFYFGNSEARSVSAGPAVFGEFAAAYSFANNSNLANAEHALLTLTGQAPASVLGVVGTSRRFDGVDDFLTVEDSRNDEFSATTMLTLSAWVQVDTFSDPSAAIISKGEMAWQLGRNGAGSGAVFTTVANNLTVNVTGMTSLDDNEWHQVVGVRAGSATQLFIDGALVNSATVTGPINQSTQLVRIGNNPDSATQYWRGRIDEVRISATARTPAQIAADYRTVNDPTFATLGPIETYANGM